MAVDRASRRARASHLLVRDLVSELRPAGVELIDTARWLDASGRDGPYPRSDGMHIDFAYSEAFAVGVVVPALMAFLAE